MFVLSVVFVFRQIYSSGLSLPLFSEKARENISVNQPNLYKVVAPILTTLSYFKVENHYFRQIELSQWSGVGANNKNSSTLINDQIAL